MLEKYKYFCVSAVYPVFHDIYDAYLWFLFSWCRRTNSTPEHGFGVASVHIFSLLDAFLCEFRFKIKIKITLDFNYIHGILE